MLPGVVYGCSDDVRQTEAGAEHYAHYLVQRNDTVLCIANLRNLIMSLNLPNWPRYCSNGKRSQVQSYAQSQ